MDQRKAKKTRSYGDPFHDTRPSKPSATQSKAPGSGRRSSMNERNGSPSLIAQRGRGEVEIDTTRNSSKPVHRDSPVLEDFQSSDGNVGNSQSIDASERSQALRPCRMPRNPILEVNLAVLGDPGVGKSTFIQCALDLKRPAKSHAVAKKMSLDGVVYLVRLLELQLDAIHVTTDHQLQWPTLVGDQSISRIDGALTLYDVMNKESLARIPNLINAFSKSAMPCVLVSCKCDRSPDSRQLDPRIIEQISTSFGPGNGGIDSFQTSANLPESQKRCISVILRTIISNRSGASESFTTPLRKRASTQACVLAAPTTDTSNHGRASSDILGSAYRGLSLGAGVTRPTYEKCSSPPLQAGSITQISIPVALRKHPLQPAIDSTLDESTTALQSTQASISGSGPPTVSHTLFETILSESSAADTATDNSTPDRDQAHDSDCHPSAENLGAAGANVEAPVRSCKDAGYSFDDLVDRLLSQPMSKSDAKYAAIFLCLYRKFAAPADLLTSIIDRFEALDEDDNAQMLRISSQLRHLSIMAQWVAGYPGDFAHPLTRRRMTEFVASLASNRVFAVAAKEMGYHLEVISNDDDTNWACSDASRARTNTMDTVSSTSSIQISTSTLDAKSPADDAGRYYDSTTDGKTLGSSTRHSATSSDSSIVGRSGSNSTGSVQALPNTVESAQRQAQLLVPNPRHPLTKIQWHQFMETSDEDIARELTRIDWIMFSSIRPRDLVRHVSSPANQKGKCRSLEHIDRMTEQFNHVAYWVTNIILLREKPKHRAKALEKFMDLAWKLRYLNNYNSLGAVIAGINGSAVLRLTQTRELVGHQAQKDFMRLEILMGTQKSHFAYRLAWENTSSERIPFLPLHRRDLVSAEQGNKTYIGDRINWKKYEIMGEVIVEIQRSQGTPYPVIPQNEEIQRLVLESRITKDDDELYDRSVQLEAAGGGENTKRKFGWFQR